MGVGSSGSDAGQKDGAILGVSEGSEETVGEIDEVKEVVGDVDGAGVGETGMKVGVDGTLDGPKVGDSVPPPEGGAMIVGVGAGEIVGRVMEVVGTQNIVVES